MKMYTQRVSVALKIVFNAFHNLWIEYFILPKEYHIMSEFRGIKLFLTSQSLPFHVISKEKRNDSFFMLFKLEKVQQSLLGR